MFNVNKNTFSSVSIADFEQVNDSWGRRFEAL